MHEHNRKMKNSLWSHFSKILGVKIVFTNCILIAIYRS